MVYLLTILLLLRREMQISIFSMVAFLLPYRVLCPLLLPRSVYTDERYLFPIAFPYNGSPWKGDFYPFLWYI